MAKKLKGLSDKVNFSKKLLEDDRDKLKFYQHPIFCFKHITSNNRFNLDYFDKDRDREVASNALVEKIMQLSQHSFVELLNFGKGFSFETIPYEQFSIRLGITGKELSKETKLYVFRFKEQNYRVICFKSEIIPTLLHILAFDFNFSAYKHG